MAGRQRGWFLCTSSHESSDRGAHTVGLLMLHESFTLAIRQCRAVNPIAGTNWESTRISPPVEVPTDRAKEKADPLAPQTIKGTEQDIR